MKSLFKYIVLLCTPLLMMAAPVDDCAPDKIKSIEKTFYLVKDGLLEINNSFGNVNIQTWDKPSVYIKVTVEVTGGNDDQILKQLNNIEVDFSASSSKVSARTAINEINSSNWNWFKNNARTNMKINYEIRMPDTATLNVYNDYGTISLDRLLGPATLQCDYGRIAVNHLLNENNLIKADYTTNSHVNYMKAGTIKADYSAFKIYGAERIDVSGDYSKFSFELVKNLEYNTDFSTIKVDKATTINGRGDYTTQQLGTIERSVEINSDFGSITVDRMGSQFKNVTIKSEYTKVNIGYDAAASFDFTARAAYASLNLDSGLQITRSDVDNTTKTKAGYSTKSQSGNTVELRSEFGSITLRAVR